jgi:hypothetical protein
MTPDTAQLLRLANAFLSLATLPAAMYMFHVIFSERTLVKNGIRGLSILLATLFLLVFLSSMINLGYFAILLFGGTFTSVQHNIRFLAVTAVFFIGSWGFVYYRNRNKK